MRRAVSLVATLTAIAAAVAACDTSTTSAAPGKLTVLLTDAPFSTTDVRSATIFVRNVACRQAVVNAEEAENTASTGWTTVASPDQAIDLIPLNNGVTLNLGTMALPAGTWQSCRIVIDPTRSFIELTDGTRPDIKWPSAAQSGIKILLNEPVSVQDSSVLVVDFDVGSSFVLRGNDIHNNGLLFKPVVHGVLKDVAATFSGFVRADSANGDAMAGALVQLLPAGTAVDDGTTAALRTATTDATGAFTFHFVAPGSYAVRAIPDTASGYKPALLSGGVTLTDSETAAGAVIVVIK